MPKKTHYNAKIRTGKDQNFTSFELSSPQVGERVAQSDPISHKPRSLRPDLPLGDRVLQGNGILVVKG